MKEEYLQEISNLREQNQELTNSLRESINEKERCKKEIAQREETNYSLGFFVGIAVAYLYLRCFTDLDVFLGLGFGEIIGKLLVESVISIIVSFACLVIGTLVKIGIDSFESPYGTTTKKKLLVIAILLVCAFFIATCIVLFKVL